MDNNNQALTTPEDAPPLGDPAPVEQPGADVTSVSSTDGVKPASLEDAISDALGEEKVPEKQPEAPPAEEKAKSEESVEEPEGNQEDPAPVEKKDDLNLDALSKKAQARFRELAKEKAALDEIRRYAGDEQGFNGFRELLKLHAEDPAQAVPMLEKVLQDAKERAGLVVKSDDIRQKLDDGLIDDAAAVELEQSRRERERLKLKAEQAEQQRKQQEAQQLMTAQTEGLNAWEKNVRERYPDFDNVADMVKDRLQALAMQEYPQTVEAAVALANQALADVTSRVKRLQPARSATKVHPSSGTSTKITAAPKSIEDIVNRVLG
jgi:hypothetical protein